MNAWQQPPPQSPYAPPGAWTSHDSFPPAAPPISAGPNASTVLYTPNQMMLASFLGAPLAGAILLAINEQRLGRPKGVLAALAFGFGLTVLVLGLAFALPDNFPGLPISLAGMGAIRAIAHVKQAEQITRHLQWGGRKGSGWVAAGIGLLSALLVVVIAVGAAIAIYAITGRELE